MSIHDWQELSIKTPSTFSLCLEYFEQHHTPNWHQQMNNIDRLLEFLASSGVGVRIWMSNHKWGYEIFENSRRVTIVRDITAREDANTGAIKAAFFKCETDQNIGV